jgi:hypothetical protein
MLAIRPHSDIEERLDRATGRTKPCYARENHELPEHMDHLLRCTFRFDGWVSPLSWLSMFGWDDVYGDRWRGIIPQRDTWVALCGPLPREMLRHWATGIHGARGRHGLSATVGPAHRRGWLHASIPSPPRPCSSAIPSLGLSTQVRQQETEGSAQIQSPIAFSIAP